MPVPKLNKFGASLLGMLCIIACKGPLNADDPPISPRHRALHKPDSVKIPMRDGIELAATVSLPRAGSGKYPVVLIRTPYGRGDAYPDLRALGYATVNEDVRGRGESGGIWEPFLNERKDGYVTVEWIARQPWCNGKVGMIGASYMGYVQWAAAAERPPALKCIVPIVSPPDPFQNLPYENGCLLEAVDLWYATIVGTTEPAPKSDQSAKKYNTWPVTEADLSVDGGVNAIYRKWVQMDRPEDWRRGETIASMRNSTLPSLSISGWFDGDQMGTQMRWESRSANCPDQWVVFGPWGHDQALSSRYGDIAINPGTPPDVAEIEHRFLARWLKDETDALKDVPHVQAFALGANRWLKGDKWPVRQARPESMYLAGDNLELTKPAEVSSRKYDYDPLHVRSTRPLAKGPLEDTVPYKLSAEDLPFGHLLYRSMPLNDAEIVTGPANLDLCFRSSAKDTDFFAQMFDEFPDSGFIPIGQAAKFRVKAFVTKGVDLRPGQTYSAHVPFWESLYELKKGHRLTLMISSDKMPVYALNSNTGEHLAESKKPVVAHQTILSGGEHASRIEVGILRD